MQGFVTQPTSTGYVAGSVAGAHSAPASLEMGDVPAAGGNAQVSGSSRDGLTPVLRGELEGDVVSAEHRRRHVDNNLSQLFWCPCTTDHSSATT